MQPDLDYITDVLYAIDINLEDMRYRLSEITTEISNMEIT